MLTSEYHNEYFNDNTIVCSIMQYVNIGLSKWKMQSTFNILNIQSQIYRISFSEEKVSVLTPNLKVIEVMKDIYENIYISDIFAFQI